MKFFEEGKLMLWMPKATKFKGGKFRLPCKAPFKVRKMFNNNIVELSTISNDKGSLQGNMRPIHSTSHSFCNEFHENLVQ
jgi:hypothetical protein